MWLNKHSNSVPDSFLCLIVLGVCRYPEQVFVDTSDILVDGDVVVVQDDEHVSLADTGVVESFEGKTSGQGSVSDKSYCLVGESLLFCGFCKSESC